MKPEDIFLNWYVDSSDEFHLGKIVLGDMDCALKLKGDKLLSYKIGNIIWRKSGRTARKRRRKAFQSLLLYSFGKSSAWLDLQKLINCPIQVSLRHHGRRGCSH